MRDPFNDLTLQQKTYQWKKQGYMFWIQFKLGHVSNMLQIVRILYTASYIGLGLCRIGGDSMRRAKKAHSQWFSVC